MLWLESYCSQHESLLLTRHMHKATSGRVKLIV